MIFKNNISIPKEEEIAGFASYCTYLVNNKIFKLECDF